MGSDGLREGDQVALGARLRGGVRVRTTRALGVGAQDAELVALRVGEDDPAAAVVVAAVGDDPGAQTDDPVDLGVAGPVGRDEARVHAVLDGLALGHGEEEQPATVRTDQAALLVTGRHPVTVLDGEVLQDVVPPHRLGVGVVGIEAEVADDGTHVATLEADARPRARIILDRMCRNIRPCTTSSPRRPPPR